ncbi:hypothetical protein P154DRAFT_517759 [Amniculicola lignicola CBS 123094]|uniref:Uncharacterized protein n=1 Tax=Amniculicola lignicola CBS 123094 TaxID=1392246 RepID=A0A6A5X0K2_9PLEO|nr:hypothetical protein P154DRAFT_517759 [Amniculicola lignicola CBS 123094]
MVYSWEDKEAECYRLYVEEKRSLDEVLAYWQQRDFAPSRRAFQTQFKRWNFPSKQNPAHKQPELIERVKELWGRNTTQKDMVETLNKEGFEINDRELMRLRNKLGFFLRERRKGTGPRKQKESEGCNIAERLARVASQPTVSTHQDEPETSPENIDPAEVLRRQLRMEQLQMDSAEKWRQRKRRRRTRGWAGLPADDAGEPPRFPSETTLDESKAYLNLDNDLYRQVREDFRQICESQGVIKKTISGPEIWGRAKRQLVHDSDHLSTVFLRDPDALQQIDQTGSPSNMKALSLDVICMDVTKRMRTADNRMAMPEAKNALGLNPEETRQVRKAFAAILKAGHITNKYEAGDDRWNELKEHWVRNSELLTQALTAGENADPQYAEKVKAVEVLARDVMKRLRNDTVKKDASQKKQINMGPGPGPMAPAVGKTQGIHRNRQTTGNSSTPPSNNPMLPTASEMQIDPSLLLAASDLSVLTSHMASVSHHPSHQTQHSQYMSMQQVDVPIPIYFRLHPHSTTTVPSKMIWLDILQTRSITHIKSLVMREHPGTVMVRLEGLLVYKTPGQPDREVMIAVDDEDELAAYLGHVAGGKATFVVLLALAGYI